MVTILKLGISERRDHNPSEKIKDVKKRLKRYCHSKRFLFIDNISVDENSLKKSLLHSSRYGNRLFPGNLVNVLNGF